jgi:hypothetical protein
LATYARQIASGSTNGRAIPVAATATPGTLIHTATALDNGADEVYLWASNVTGTARWITVEWGGVTDPGDHIVKQYVIPANSPPIPIVTGQTLKGGLAVRAFAETASAINVTANINAIR